jgi:hypothetical protein
MIMLRTDVISDDGMENWLGIWDDWIYTNYFEHFVEIKVDSY